MKEFVRAYQAFEVYDASGIRQHGLTVPQADVIFSLGQSGGMTFKELGAATFITKGTLTGVIDRLEYKQLVIRKPTLDDRRSMLVVLTELGSTLVNKIYPLHMAHLQQRFDKLTEKDKELALHCLQKIQRIFS